MNSDKKSFKWNVILDGQEVTDLSECIDGTDNDKNTIKLRKKADVIRLNVKLQMKRVELLGTVKV